MKREREKDKQEISKSCRSRKVAANGIDIHHDLLVEILKKLPVKSLLRFRCVSKQWLSIIQSNDFIDSIIARPLAEPPSDNLYFIFHHYCSPKPFFVFSSTYTYTEQEKLSLPRERKYVRGLICCWSAYSPSVIIYNPTTRQSISLPEVRAYNDPRYNYCFFGYEPVMNQYKVLCVIIGKDESEHSWRVFTLGDPMKQWRIIQGFGIHRYEILKTVYINGIIYFSEFDYSNKRSMVMSFDFNLERFYHINAHTVLKGCMKNPNFVNYKGKLGCLCHKHPHHFGAEMWVMEDIEKQTWSKIFDLPEIKITDLDSVVKWDCLSGVTLGGEIFTVDYWYKRNDPLYVYFYDPKQKILRRTEIKGTTERSDGMAINGVSNHVENIMSLRHMA